MGLLKTKEVASILRVSEGTVKNLIKKNKLKGIKVGSMYRIDDKDLEDFLKTKNSIMVNEK